MAAAIDNGMVEISVTWCGSYSWMGRDVSSVHLFLASGSDAISCCINTQLPSSQMQLLPLRLSQKLSPDRCKQLQLPLWNDSKQNIRTGNSMICPFHVAMTLEKIFIRTFRICKNYSRVVKKEDGKVDYETQGLREDFFIRVEPHTLSFQAGQKYQLHVANSDGLFCLSISPQGAIENACLPSQVFDKVASAVIDNGIKMVHLGEEKVVLIAGRGNYVVIIQQIIEWVQGNYSLALISSFLENFDPKQIVATGDQESDTAIFYISQAVIKGLKMSHPVMISAEKTKQLMTQAEEYYHAHKWSELFAILRGQVPIIEENEAESRSILYMNICNLARRNRQPELLIYTYNEAPASRNKEMYGVKYTQWLAATFEMNIQPRFGAPLEECPLTAHAIFEWILNKLPSVIYGGDNVDIVEEEVLAYLRTLPEKTIDHLLLTYLESITEPRTEISQKAHSVYYNVFANLQQNKERRNTHL